MTTREALLTEAAKEEALEVITEWKHFWMNQKQHSQADYENYRDRAMGVDANMKHDLATRIATWEAQRSAVLLEALEKLLQENLF